MKLSKVIQIGLLFATMICFYYVHDRVKWVGLGFLIACVILHFWDWIKKEATTIEGDFNQRSTGSK